MANEKRLIDAYKLEDLVRGNSARYHHVDDVIAAIAGQPTVDAVEVVHGRWALEKEYADGTADYKCSACEYDDNFNRNLVNAFYKYCPYCGAKMDGGNDDG